MKIDHCGSGVSPRVCRLFAPHRPQRPTEGVHPASRRVSASPYHPDWGQCVIAPIPKYIHCISYLHINIYIYKVNVQREGERVRELIS